METKDKDTLYRNLHTHALNKLSKLNKTKKKREISLYSSSSSAIENKNIKNKKM